MADVFISYSRTDRPIAGRLAAALEARGISYWMDSHLAGGSTFTKVTEEELNNAGKVIVLWSSTSIDSGWVCDEAQLGREQGKLIPLTIDGSQPPMGFRQIQTIDMAEWVGDAGSDLPAALLAALSIERGSAQAHPAEGAPANKGRRPLVAAVVAGLLVLLGAGYLMFRGGDEAASSRAEDRIPVLVRSFGAGGSGDLNEAAMASGITDELINRLRRIPELRISSAHGDGSAPTASFSDANVVEGSIRSSGDELRVTARLIKPSGEILWSQTFDRKLVDLFDVQEAIAANIASALSVSLDVGYNATANGGTNNPEAYAAYVQGLGHALDVDPSAQAQYFQQAIALDPDFIQALSWLSASYGSRIREAKDQQEVDRLIHEMDVASARALAAGPDVVSGIWARGWYLLTTKDIAAADRLMTKVGEMQDDLDPSTREDFAIYQSMLGRNRKALSIVEANALVDPIYQESRFKSFMLMLNGRYRESTALFDKIVEEQDQNLQLFYFHQFWSLVLLGEDAKALAFVRSLGRDDLDRLADEFETFGEGQKLVGKTLPELRRWADENFSIGDQNSLSDLAFVAAHRGHTQLAVDLMRIAYEKPGGYTFFFLWYPALANARKTEAFAQLVTDLGFPRAWEESGDWGDYCQPRQGGGITCH